MNRREAITHSVINSVIDRKLINTVEKKASSFFALDV
jgi:hypothetical protein